MVGIGVYYTQISSKIDRDDIDDRCSVLTRGATIPALSNGRATPLPTPHFAIAGLAWMAVAAKGTKPLSVLSSDAYFSAFVLQVGMSS